MTRRFFFVFSSAVAVSLAGCARPVEREAEKRVNSILPQYLGPADHYETRVRGESAGAVLRGRLKRVEVTGTNVRLSETLIVDRVQLQFGEVEVDTKARQLRGIGDAHFQCRIAPARLNRYLHAVRPEMKNLVVSFNRNALVVDARPEVLGITSVPVRVEGKLRPRQGGRLLDFDPDKGKLSIVPVPEIVLDYVVRKLTPAIDLSGLTVPVRINSAEVQDGYLTLAGIIEAGDILRLAK